MHVDTAQTISHKGWFSLAYKHKYKDIRKSGIKHKHKVVVAGRRRSCLTALCLCLCLFHPSFHLTQARHKHSISTRRTERVRSSCAYAYAFV